MRLTLRTLLAYLDDTLEPTEAKLIGQKVAESDTAQELIARIKEVTRRRRITAPTASGPGAKVDPNSVAEYLDNELSADQLAEVEQLALSSDVHLAEIAACHQILTLVLGEPARVPPSAYKRMYGLVKPPESNPSRQPPVRRGADDLPHRESRDVDETLRLGLPALKESTWTNRLILAGAAVAILLLLALAIWNLMPPSARETDGSAQARTGPSKTPFVENDDKKDKSTAKVENDIKTKKESEKDIKPSQPKDTEKVKDKGPEAGGKSIDVVKDNKTPEPEKEKEQPPAAPDLTVGKELGSFEPKGNALLLQRLGDKKGAKNWVRLLRTVKEPARVVANYPLMSLPGYKSTVALDSGLHLTLWGNLPELLPYSLESLVLLHPNDKFDVDLTLQRGRVQLTNPKDQPLKARVRFDNPANPKKGEVWDLTLHDKGTEVVLMVLSYMPIGEPFYPDRDNTQRLGPMADVVVLATAGKASLKTDLNAPLNLLPPNEGTMHRWNSRMGPQNIPMEKGLPPWVNSPPPVDPKVKAGFLRAVDSLNTELTSQAIDSVLLKAINSTEVYKSRLAVRCAAALDDIQRLLDVMTTDKEREVRWEAKERLQAWIAYTPDNEYVLYDMLQPAFDKGEAAMFMQLLRNFPLEQLKDPMQGAGIFQALIGYLGKEQRKVAIRELAYYHLWHLVPEGRNIPYSATMPAPQLDQAQAEWRKLIPPGNLPPAFKAPAGK